MKPVAQLLTIAAKPNMGYRCIEPPSGPTPCRCLGIGAAGGLSDKTARRDSRRYVGSKGSTVVKKHQAPEASFYRRSWQWITDIVLGRPATTRFA
jgi:hypothetical protein